jgi:hypothetical protein
MLETASRQHQIEVFWWLIKEFIEMILILLAVAVERQIYRF